MASLDKTARANLRDAMIRGERCRVVSFETSGPANFPTHIYLKSGKLARITWSPERRSTLQHVVDRLGPPEYVEALKAVGPEDWVYVLSVYYPSKGMSFELGPGAHDLGEVEATVPVEAVIFSQPGDLKTYLQLLDTCITNDEIAEPYAEERMQRMQAWQGFGKKLQTFDTR